jgi:hypothetical protein
MTFLDWTLSFLKTIFTDSNDSKWFVSSSLARSFLKFLKY